MKRYFNTEGACNPKEHYMVKLDDRLVQIRTMLVEKKKYFVINRGRQYGKITTMKALAKYLGEDYLVLSMDFQKLSARDFENEPTFYHKDGGYMLSYHFNKKKETGMKEIRVGDKIIIETVV